MMVIQLFDFRKEFIGAIMSLQQRSTPPRGAIHASSSNRDLCLFYLTVTGQALALTVPRWQGNPVRYSDRDPMGFLERAGVQVRHLLFSPMNARRSRMESWNLPLRTDLLSRAIIPLLSRLILFGRITNGTH